MKTFFSRLKKKHYQAGYFVAALMMARPSYAHASLTDWLHSWKEFAFELWPVINIFAIVIGAAFALVGLVGWMSAKKNNQPALGWQPVFMIGGVICTILFLFIAATGDTITGGTNEVQNSMDQWGGSW